MPGTFRARWRHSWPKFQSAPASSAKMRSGLLNDIRYDRKAPPRMIDQCASLALPRGASLPAQGRRCRNLLFHKGKFPHGETRWGSPATGPVVVLAPGAIGPSKRWHDYEGLAKTPGRQKICGLDCRRTGRKRRRAEQMVSSVPQARDLTGPDLFRNAILALAAANVAVSRRLRLLCVYAAAALQYFCPSRIFGPTDPVALGACSTLRSPQSRNCCSGRVAGPATNRPAMSGHHRCMRDIPADRILDLVEAAPANPAARSAPIMRPAAAAQKAHQATDMRRTKARGRQHSVAAAALV